MALGSGFFNFIALSKVLILNEHGILCKSIVKETFLNWSEVKDYGLSYSGNTRNGSATFDLYFSKEILETKNADEKKTRSSTIRVMVVGRKYKKVIDKIIS